MCAVTSHHFTVLQAKSLYGTVAVEFDKINQQGMRAQTDISALAHICGQLVPYVNVKTEMIDLYPSGKGFFYTVNNWDVRKSDSY